MVKDPEPPPGGNEAGEVVAVTWHLAAVGAVTPVEVFEHPASSTPARETIKETKWGRDTQQ
jgi:hypothetical protein